MKFQWGVRLAYYFLPSGCPGADWGHAARVRLNVLRSFFKRSVLEEEKHFPTEMTPRSLQEKHTTASAISCSILPGCKLCNTFFRSLTLRSQMDESALEKLRTHFTEEYMQKRKRK